MERTIPSAKVMTWSGLSISLLEPEPDDINIYDIARALSRICRFGGHTRRFFSVAEHSMAVAESVSAKSSDPKAVLVALLHDASEAYLGDVITPLKKILGDYTNIEARWQQTIMRSFGLVSAAKEHATLVARADEEAVRAEFAAYMVPTEQPSYQGHDTGVSHDTVMTSFLNFYFSIINNDRRNYELDAS